MSDPRSGKLRTLNEDDDNDDDEAILMSTDKLLFGQT